MTLANDASSSSSSAAILILAVEALMASSRSSSASLKSSLCSNILLDRARNQPTSGERRETSSRINRASSRAFEPTCLFESAVGERARTGCSRE